MKMRKKRRLSRRKVRFKWKMLFRSSKLRLNQLDFWTRRRMTSQNAQIERSGMIDFNEILDFGMF